MPTTGNISQRKRKKGKNNSKMMNDRDGNTSQVSQHLMVKSKLIMGIDQPTSHPSAKRII